MKVRINKKNIKRISIVLLATVFLGCISLIIFLWGRDVKFDKYGEYIGDCIQEKRFGEVRLKCQTILEVIDRSKKEEVCLNFLMIKSNTTPVPFVICEKEQKIIGLDNPDIHSVKKIPMDIELQYKRGLFQDAKFNSVKVTLMSDSDYTILFSSLAERNYFISNVRPQSDLELEKAKFYTHALDIKGMEDIWFLMLRNVIVKNSYVKGNEMFFELEISVKDYKFNIDVSSEAILFLGGEIPENILYKEDISEVIIGESYRAGFIYIPIETVVDEGKVQSLCESNTTDNFLIKLFCDSKRTMQSLLLEEDIEIYFKTLADRKSSSVDNLMFFLLQRNE